MIKLTGESKKVKEIVKETLDVFSATSLEIEDNRLIIAETIAKDLHENKARLEGDNA